MPELNECFLCFLSLLQESAHSNIHLVKLTRLLRLARLLQKMDRYSQYSAVILTMLMLFFIVVAHWLACIWYVIAEKERLRNDKDWDLGKSLGISALFNICNLHFAEVSCGIFTGDASAHENSWIVNPSRIRKYSLYQFGNNLRGDLRDLYKNHPALPTLRKDVYTSDIELREQIHRKDPVDMKALA